MNRKRRSLLTIDSFSPDADKLRAQFEERFADPKSSDPGRFIWDYWHVAGQYTALRTPAYHFFSQRLYSSFHNQLVWWGRRNLGCHDISPPWMSCYVEGCRQELHGDLPHGPWAFVYSLTPWKKRLFRGGETILLKEETLSFWQGFKSSRGLEQSDIVTSVPSLFNRLTVFDPRIPHGVRRVEGVHDVLQGRLVIHGWFVQPRPFIEGPLETRDLKRVIDDLSGSLKQLFASGLEIQGTMALRMNIAKSGQLERIKILTNALRHPAGDVKIEDALIKHIRQFLLKSSFRKAQSTSIVTLPLIFESQ